MRVDKREEFWFLALGSKFSAYFSMPGNMVSMVL